MVSYTMKVLYVPYILRARKTIARSSTGRTKIFFLNSSMRRFFYMSNAFHTNIILPRIYNFKFPFICKKPTIQYDFFFVFFDDRYQANASSTPKNFNAQWFFNISKGYTRPRTKFEPQENSLWIFKVELKIVVFLL